MSCLAEMMPLPIVSPSGDRVVDHRLLLGVASSSDRSWLHRMRGVTSAMSYLVHYDNTVVDR